MSERGAETRTTSHARRVIFVALLGFVGLVANHLLHYHRGSFIYDEGDYYVAASRGFWNNWFDADDVSIVTFARAGTGAATGKIERGELSRMIRSSGSTAFRRHYHPPFAFYPPIAAISLFPDATPEHQLRVGNFLLMILFIGIISLVGLRYPAAWSPWIILLPTSANWIMSAGGFNMHIPFGLSVTTGMMFWYAYEMNRSRKWLRIGAIGAFTVATASVEYSLFLLGLLGIWGLLDLWRGRDEWRSRLRSRGFDLLWFTGFLAIVWPAGVFKVGLLKSWALQTYIALFRLRSVDSGFDSFWDMLLGKFSPSPLEIALLLIGLGLLAALGKTILRSGSLFVATGLSLAILATQASPSLVLPWYLMPLFCLTFVYVYHRFWSARGWNRQREFRTAALAGLVVFVLAQATVDVVPETRSREVAEIVGEIPERDIVTVQILAPQIAAYFPERNVTGYHEQDLTREEYRDSLNLWAREAILILLTDGGLHPSEDVAVPFDTVRGVTIYRPAGKDTGR